MQLHLRFCYTCCLLLLSFSHCFFKFSNLLPILDALHFSTKTSVSLNLFQLFIILLGRIFTGPQPSLNNHKLLSLINIIFSSSPECKSLFEQVLYLWEYITLKKIINRSPSFHYYLSFW